MLGLWSRRQKAIARDLSRKGEAVARKPNYQFERQERDRAKAAKKVEKAARRREGEVENNAGEDAGAGPSSAKD